MNLRFDPDARQEADDLGDWFNARRAGGGAGFAADLNDLLARVLAQPRLYGRVAGAPHGREVRVGRTRRFPALVYYEVTPTAVVVLAVVHSRSRRRPWRRRLP